MQLDLEELISAHSDSPVNQSAKQESKRASQMTGGSGMKLLEYYKLVNRNGSLLKMLSVLLTSTKGFYSNKSNLIWKKKVSKSNVSLFQLQVSVQGTTETEYGYLPVTYPTPTASDIEGGTAPDVQMKNGHFYRENKKGER